MENIKITLETLYDLLRNEKKKGDLERLENSFFVDVVSYLREKKALLEIKNEGDELFAAGEREKVEYELRSIKRILKEIYEKREKKIIDIAINRSRTGSDIIDTNSMLREEKVFYQNVLSVFDKHRSGVLLNLFKGDLPDIATTKTAIEEKKDEIKEELKESLAEFEEQKQIAKIKFIHPMPSFVWKDMKVYGPYDKGEEIEIFTEVANLLIRKGRAENI
jgi:DNA replication initiation complex subunit (GINS family)